MLNKGQSNTKDLGLIYYNIDIKNETKNRIIPSFNVTRVNEILDCQENYDMAVVRMSIPLNNIPLFIFRENYFNVSLKINNSSYTETLVWIPNNVIYNEQNVYNIQQLLNMINNAWETAFTLLKSENTITSTTAPFLTYSGLSNLITLNVPSSYLADNIDIFTNTNLHRRLHNFYDFYNESYLEGNLNYKFIVQDLYDNNTSFNGINYLYFTQLFSSIASLSDLRSIQLITNTIPVNNELIASQSNKLVSFISDFEPIETNTYSSNGLYQFFPKGEIQYIDLLSKDNLKQINLNIKWTNNENEVIPYYLGINENISVKLLFKKKDNLILENFINNKIN
jgi:hypothetical protein